MENKKEWQVPTITEINVDNEISALMTSPPGDPFASIDNNDAVQNDPFA